MSVAAVHTPESEKPNAADRLADAARHAAHISHQARLVTSVACDAIEDSAHEAKRAAKQFVQRGIERLEDTKDEGVHYVKRQPLKAIAMAAGVGLMIGMAAGWITSRFSQQRAGKC